MTWTTPRTWVAGETVTAAQLNTHLRDNLAQIAAAWTSYTPTFSGVYGNATVACAYNQIGKLVLFSISITSGTTTTWGSGTLTWTLPTSNASFSRMFPASIENAGLTPNFVQCYARVGSGTATFNIAIASTTTNGDWNLITNSHAMCTSATTIIVNGAYEST